MGIDLSSLSPEELEQLKSAIENPPVDPIKELASVISLMCDKVEALENRLGGLEKKVIDELMGGILELGQENIRTSRISGLKGKYGELFSPYSSYLADKLGGNADSIYDLIDEHLQGLQGVEGYNDEMGDTSIHDIAAEIGRRVAEITGKPVEVEVAKVEAAETPKEGAKEEAKPEDDGMGSIKDYISKLKDRSGQAA